MHMFDGEAVWRMPLRFAMKSPVTLGVVVMLLIFAIGCNGFVGEARVTTSDAKATTKTSTDQKTATEKSKGTSSDVGRSQRH